MFFRNLKYIYNAARNAFDTGVGLIRPMYYEHPQCDEAYAGEKIITLITCNLFIFSTKAAPNGDFAQYYFGPDMIVAPVVRPADASGLNLFYFLILFFKKVVFS